MRTLSFILLALLSCTSLFAQNNKTGQAEHGDNILVVPFSPQMYTAVGDHFICKQSNMTPGELADMIRRTLVKTLDYNLSKYYNVFALEGEATPVRGSDLFNIYNITRVEEKQKKVKKYYKGYPMRKPWELFMSPEERWGHDCAQAESGKPNRKIRKYMNADITEDSIFHNICKKHDAAYVLYLTQFEMHTRFGNCLDMQRTVFQRDLFIHFTLLDNTGQYVDGGVVGTTFQSNSNDAKHILENNMGRLTSYIVGVVRRNL